MVGLELFDNNLSSSIPQALCAASSLTRLGIANNDHVTCFSGCLNGLGGDFGTVPACGSALCGFVASTDIESVGTVGEYSRWSCDTAMVPATEPCDAASAWPGVVCVHGQVTELSLFAAQITGSLPTSLALLVALEFLVLEDNLLTGEVPNMLSGLSRLTHINLNQNFLTGKCNLQCPFFCVSLCCGGTPL